ncbi:MFS general substrate transporter [Xylona heveae TC161]|uniref:MFS general substrate transporter n=1 Tax=Xylona heveae (strain CBS 132557 / TC161) TaxID=1328760 RepID=A0A165FH00_XYLHT|nr:MFS general substrate transporter [Xylona heveae TC161]KZF20969.1 MFS general substrate transporter [Xylona heveae TC161]
MSITVRTPLLRNEHVSSQLREWDDPRKWSAVRKWTLAILVSNYAVMGPVSASMVVTSIKEISADLNLHSEVASQLLVGIFVLGLSLGPLFMAPLSEVYGRCRVLNTGHALFLVVNILSALETNGKRFLLLRFFGGFVGSSPNAIGTGILSDLWSNEDRGHSLAVYTFLPLAGPAIGPIMAQLILEKASWRYIFWASSSFIGATLLVGIFLLQETFAPVLLRKHSEQCIRPGHPTRCNVEHPFNKSSDRITWYALLKQEMSRPFILLGSQPIIQILALYIGYLFGLNQLTIATYQSLWTTSYREPKITASLHYISIALGFILGCQIGGPINDKIYAALKRKHGIGLPEFRTTAMIIASVFVPIGQILYGWTAQRTCYWIFPDIGIVIYSFGLIIGYQCIQSYVLDCYPTYSASAIGALSFLRALAGCAFPVLGPPLYRALGYGWTSSLLAAVAILVGLPAPMLLNAWGPRLRRLSPYAAGETVNL